MLETLTDARGETRKIERRDGVPLVVRTGWTDERGTHCRLVVKFGLHMIRGNHAPYFTLTCDEYENGRYVGGGAAHELSLREFPELTDLVALHLSDIDGQPMHAESNGWYQLAGALGGLGERYHAGNAETYGRPRDCWQSFADHCRISVADARSIGNLVMSHDMSQYPWKERTSNKRRVVWVAVCEGMRQRWKREAEAAIAKYGLPVFGDHWKAA